MGPAKSGQGSRLPHLGDVQRYWSEGDPEPYIEVDPSRSVFLVNLARRHISTEARILELGCNAGRNLAHLVEAGFRHLEGVEISGRAVRLLRETYPDVARSARIQVAPIEEAIREFPDDAFDLVFTMAVLEHIHTESEWIFPEIARVTRDRLITIEDERKDSDIHFPRNYREVFEALGLRQVEEVRPLSVEGLIDVENFVARVFTKTGTTS